MSALAQERRESPGQEKRTEGVHAPRLFEFPRLDVCDRCPFVTENAGVVDQDIEPSDLGLDKAADGVDRVSSRGVESMRNRAAADLRRGLGCRIAAAAGDNDPNLARGELARHFATDAAARAGDEGD